MRNLEETGSGRIYMKHVNLYEDGKGQWKEMPFFDGKIFLAGNGMITLIDSEKIEFTIPFTSVNYVQWNE